MVIIVIKVERKVKCLEIKLALVTLAEAASCKIGVSLIKQRIVTACH